MHDVEQRGAWDDLVPAPVLEQQAPRLRQGDVAQRIDAAEHLPDAELRARRRMGDERRDRVGACGDEDEGADARLRAGHDRAEARARAPADVADPVRVDRRHRLQHVDGPAHRDDVVHRQRPCLREQGVDRRRGRRDRVRRRRDRERHDVARRERRRLAEQLAAVAARAVDEDDCRSPDRSGRHEEVALDRAAAACE